ncbi:transglycosylase family protein [Streptomyces griseus]|uniref:Resuscitation-promoting factor protein RpfC n=1 Tax=Streptomyces sp. CMC78 TaxID=3231512 RepID=A0AB33KJH1_9ACTN|nr:transglycosylase family protein [Streptomyces sp. ID01-9D]MDX5574051.1 transglycosylase family protein [Streptomyces sp. ID01-9D]WSV21675.1 transglycosylase family protein [Streptomyces fimicarius]WTC89439.1 transglycosylase family protein [Streptomyces griseus]WTD67933.1 transglycosylase family protein [Streptomyces griseus]
MGSANGRHRRPRQAPAIVVAAGVTGSAIAIPLLGASGAHAAEASTWDRVAECESGGMWSADLGNGYYGGLQFSQETWSAYGGTAFAPRADLASRSQQISVAEKVLDDQGPKAWPSCAVISGLAVDGSLPGVDPGTSPTPDPTSTPTDEADAPDEADESGKSGEADKSSKGEKKDEKEGDGTGEGSETPDSSVTPTTPPSSEAPAATDPSGAPDASTGETGTDGKGGKHRGAPAPEEADGGQDDGPRESGRHASRGDGDARDGGAAGAGAYTVQPGDNLWAIADAQELPGGWTGLYETNKDLLGSDPDLILPGQSLDLGLGQDAEQAGEQGADQGAPEGAEVPAAN